MRDSNPSGKPTRKIDWNLSHEAFARLLAALDDDRERAGEMYEQIRRVLVTFFDWRGCADPESLADETFNRVARRLEEGEEIRSLPVYCQGVARRMVLEILPKQSRRVADIEDLPDLPAPTVDFEEKLERERNFNCLEHCLKQMPADQRELVIGYYKGERGAKIDHRVELAESLGLSMNSLRVRVHRLKARLEECVKGCSSLR